MHSRITTVVLSLLAVTLSCVADGLEKRLTSEDRENIEAVIDRLERCATTDAEKALVEEVRLRCEGMLFLRGRGVDREKALSYLIGTRSMAIIVKGLTHVEVDARIDTTQALAKLNDPTAVPDLLKALKSTPVTMRFGSSDSYGPQIALRAELVKALEQLTGQKFGVTDTEDQQQLNKVIQAAEKWLKDRKDLPPEKSQ